MNRLARKLIVGCALLGYFAALGLFFARSLPVSARLVFAMCPPAIFTAPVDPSLGGVALVLAPLNAVVYGAVGALIALLVSGVSHQLRLRA